MIKTATNVEPNEAKDYRDRYANLEQQIKDLNADKSELIKEMNNRGHDGKAFKVAFRISARREKDPKKFQQEDDMVNVYLTAWGEGSN
jgi:uncharacterized protein (UPF0335 family)